MATADLFTQAITEFSASVVDNFSQLANAQPEDQLKPLVGDLVKGSVLPTSTELSPIAPRCCQMTLMDVPT